MNIVRASAAAGITTTALAFVEFLGPSFPMTGDTSTQIDRYFGDHRNWVLASTTIQAAGDMLWVVFLCGLTLVIARSRAVGPALLTLSGGLLNVAISLAGLSCIAGLGFEVAGSAAPGLSRSLFIIASMTLVLSNVMLAVMAAGAALSNLPTWFRGLSGAGAVLFLAGGAALAQSGPFSPDGALQFATYGFELAWTVAASVLMLGPTVSAEPSVTVPATPMATEHA